MRQSEVIRQILEAERVDLHVALPGRVRSYDADRQTAEVVLGVRRVIPGSDDDRPDLVEDYPILPAVRVVWPRGGGYSLHFPLTEGDGVLVVVCESDLSAWLTTGEPSDPGVATRHGLSGAVAIPGLSWDGAVNPAPSSDSLRMGKDTGPRLEITASEVRAGGTEALAIGADVRAHLQAISTALATLTGPGGAVAASTPYVYATVLAGSPVDTVTTKGE